MHEISIALYNKIFAMLCTETTVSNPPVIFPKSCCDVHLFRGPWAIPFESILRSAVHEDSSIYMNICSHSNYVLRYFCEKYFASAIATHFLQVCSFLFVTRRNRLCTSSFNVKRLTTAPLNSVGQFMLDFKES